MSDSLKLEATGETRDRLIALLDLCACQRVTGMVEVGGTLKLVNESNPNRGDGAAMMGFRPAKLADAIIEWIAPDAGKGRGTAFPDPPDIDGDVRRGFRLVSGSRSDPIEIHPHWMHYHR